MNPYDYMITPGVYQEPNGWPIAIFTITMLLTLIITMYLGVRAHEAEMKKEAEAKDELCQQIMRDRKLQAHLNALIQAEQVIQKKYGIGRKLI
jgi:uncharacterized membrane protein